MIDVNTKKVIHVDWPSRRLSDNDVSGGTTAPPKLEEDSFKAVARERIQPPRGQWEYLPDLLEGSTATKLRPEPLKPLNVVQPEGVSFKMNGNELEWQNWKMHIGES